jgi:hypothetical protein
MKRNSLTLIFFLVFFCFMGFSLAYAQDPGIPDTMIIQKIDTVLANSQVVVGVYLNNDEHIGAYTIPLAFPDTLSALDVRCDSISFVGTRTLSPTPAGFYSDATSIENAKHRILLFAVWVSGDLAPGSGSIAKLYFSTGSSWVWNPLSSVPVDSTEWPALGGLFTGLSLSDALGLTAWVPIFGKGALDVKDVNTPTKPTVFTLAQNYPNPFNPKTMIRFALPKDSWVKLEVYNILGQKVKTLVDEKLAAGVKEVEWDGKDSKGLEVASGIYFYKIKADSFSDVKKMVMLK